MYIVQKHHFQTSGLPHKNRVRVLKTFFSLWAKKPPVGPKIHQEYQLQATEAVMEVDMYWNFPWSPKYMGKQTKVHIEKNNLKNKERVLRGPMIGL